MKTVLIQHLPDVALPPKGALKLVTLGFTIKELIGDLEWWTKDG